ncbi:MAG: L-2-hydroxyglutarate oxidase [Micromonosporaceae bacterium]|nr:L-2-hydroxyglutarate oxidase [Micromonosporaceae bacterium]
MARSSSVIVVGGGIVGLAVAARLAQPRPGAGSGCEVIVLEKEPTWAAHQTGRNSGVIHSGLYYRPGSRKASMCQAASASMLAFAREHGVPAQRCGKLVVAVTQPEVERLRALQQRAEANQVPVRWLEPSEIKEFEPKVAAIAALRVESTGITDYRAICTALAEQLADHGADLRLSTRVTAIRADGQGVTAETTGPAVRADALVNCAGLHSDRVAASGGQRPGVRIIPFRGEYYELRPERRDLVRGLIYPVPDPRLPFLGVHLTRMVDGSVHAGPNAVLALRREGYRWLDLSVRDTCQTLAYPGFWRLAKTYLATGVSEVARSLSKQRFAAALARLVPGITADDLVPCAAGVRAQALTPAGALVDDFLIQTGPRQVHVLNAPSPAATSALEIAAEVAGRVTAGLRATNG